jgi:aminoglycoside/choline kinase family phosphotransferase
MRERQRHEFITKHGWGYARVEPLAADASPTRRYFRLKHPELGTRLVMDVPRHPEERFDEFIEIGKHIYAVGLSAPEIYAHDAELGLAIIEDFGDDTFTRLLNNGTPPETLYQTAIAAMAELQLKTPVGSLNLKDYDTALMAEEIGWFVKWYAPMFWGRVASAHETKEFHAIVCGIFDALPPLPKTLLLRDFHVDNFMWLPAREGVKACGILDFQDAKWGSPAYDLVSVLEDARRDIDPALAQQLYQQYLSLRPDLNADAFAAHYAAMGMLRHGRILGNFIRLWVRDNKPWYLQFMPRVQRQFLGALEAPIAQPLAAWCQQNIPDIWGDNPIPNQDADNLRSIMIA